MVFAPVPHCMPSWAPRKGHASRAFIARLQEYVASFPGTPRGAQSSNDCPRPLTCGGAQDPWQQMAPAHSQPFVSRTASQFKKPGAHVPAQTPEEHVRLAIWSDAQTLLQLPQ